MFALNLLSRALAGAAALAGWAAADPGAALLEAEMGRYRAASGSPETQALEGRAVLPFYRAWHARLGAAAAVAPPSRLKSRVLSQVAVLAGSLGDPAAAADAARRRAALPASAVGASEWCDAAFQLALHSERAAGESPTAAQVAAVVADQDGARARLRALTAADRRGAGFTLVMALQGLGEAAEWRRDRGRHAEAAAILDEAVDLSAALLADRPAGPAGPPGLRFPAEGLRPPALLVRRASAEVAAGDPAAATATLRRAAKAAKAREGGDPPTPPSLLALRVAEGADPGGAGGDWLGAWLTREPPDAGTDTALAELAFARDDAGRDAEALTLLNEMWRKGALDGLPPDRFRRSRHSEALHRLRALFRRDGADGRAAEVAEDLRARFPDEPGMRFFPRRPR